jgi:hypothetical protein
MLTKMHDLRAAREATKHQDGLILIFNALEKLN